jgi:hypothetical protein
LILAGLILARATGILFALDKTSGVQNIWNWIIVVNFVHMELPLFVMPF